MNDNKEDGNYRTDCGSALPSCVLADHSIILLCRSSDGDIFHLKRSVGVSGDASETAFVDYFDDLVVMAHVTYTLAIEILDRLH